MAAGFWKGRRVFVTNPASFRGAWLCLSLLREGAQVFGYGSAAKTVPSLFELEGLALKAGIALGDLKDRTALGQALQFAEADVVFHTGADLSLKETRERPFETLNDEIFGTTALLECLRETATVRSLVILSSDKVYEQKGREILTESSHVGAGEISPTAKLCSELISLSYREQYFSPEKFNKHKVALAVARVGAAFGGGDFAEDSLVFQAMSSFSQGLPFRVRKPNSMRSWISISDQIDGLLKIAQGLWEKGPKLDPVWNLGGTQELSVAEFANLMAQEWGGGSVESESEGPRGLSYHPQLSNDKIIFELGWSPRGVSTGIAGTVTWYREYRGQSQ